MELASSYAAGIKMDRTRQPKPAISNLMTARRAFLVLGAIASLLWVAYWIRYFVRHCELGLSLACVEPNVLWTVYYSLPTVLLEVLGVPALVFVAWFAIMMASRDRDDGTPARNQYDRLRG